jgi:hypothetical protein
MNQQVIQKSAIIPSNLTETINSLSSSLKSIAPTNSQTQMINYMLIATAITGIFIYHYIKNHEEI